MKAIELIYNLTTNLSEMGSQIAAATDQHIMYMIDEARATLAAQKMDAKVSVIQMVQTVDVMPILATKEDMGQVGDSKVLKLIIPDPISYLNGGGLLTVGSTDGDVNYTRIDFSQLRTALSRKYTGAAPKWFFLENAIYIINSTSETLSKVRVRGIFDEPYKVEVLMGRHKVLDPWNFEYPLAMKDAKTVYQIALSGDLGWGDDAAQAINSSKSKQGKENELLSALQGLTRSANE